MMGHMMVHMMVVHLDDCSSFAHQSRLITVVHQTYDGDDDDWTSRSSQLACGSAIGRSTGWSSKHCAAYAEGNGMN